jgi:hypothetical protein
VVELTPQAFAERWSKSTLSERWASQQHFLNLCRMLGQPTPVEAQRTQGEVHRGNGSPGLAQKVG